MEFPKKISEVKATIQDFLANCDENDKAELHEFMKDIVAENDKPRGRKRKVSEIINELKETMHVKVEKVDEKVYITAQEKTIEHGISLPDEIWSKIFSYLPTETILGTLTRVSRHFNNIATNPTMIKSLEIDTLTKFGGRNIPLTKCEEKNIIKVIERSVGLSEFIVTGLHNVRKLLPIVLKSCSKLETLKIGHGSYVSWKLGNDAESKVDSEIAEYITNFSSLKNLYINVALSREAMDKITSMKSLKTLAIASDDMKITPEDVNAIADFDHLENLYLNFGESDDDADFDDIQMANNDNDRVKMKDAMNNLFVKQESSLKLLSLRSDFVSDIPLGILETVDLCKNLEVFCNGNLPMNKAEVEALGRLTKLKKIRLNMPSSDRLSLLNNQPDPTLTKAMLNGFVKNGCFEELEILHLDDCSEYVDIETMKCLFSRSLPKLKCLSLNHCEKLNLNDDLLIKVAESCPNLKFLNLINVGLQHVSDEVFVDLWRNRKIITESFEKEASLIMYMKNNQLTEELSQFQKARTDYIFNRKYFEMDIDLVYMF